MKREEREEREGRKIAQTPKYIKSALHNCRNMVNVGTTYM